MAKEQRPRRILTRRTRATKEELDQAAKITQADIQHADAHWLLKAPAGWKPNLHLPAYEGDAGAAALVHDP